MACHEPRRVDLTEEAADLLRTLTGRHGPLMFHQSGGCCDGSAPMCYPVGMVGGEQGGPVTVGGDPRLQVGRVLVEQVAGRLEPYGHVAVQEPVEYGGRGHASW